MFARLAKKVTTAPKQVILIMSVLAILALVGLKNTHFVSDFDSTLPNRSTLTREILANHDRFGGRNTLVFLVSGGAAEARTQAACQLSQYLEQTQGITPGQVYGAGSDSLKLVRSDAEGMIIDGLSSICTQPGGLQESAASMLGPQKNMVLAPRGDLIVSADLALSSGEFGPLLSRADSVQSGS